jgi:hypothetical protein
MKSDYQSTGIGPTSTLNLRVSVAALVRVLFENPKDGLTMLALERTASLQEIAGKLSVRISTKPFGGAVRLTNPQELEKLIGPFQYDSKQSRRERDFRIQIRPDAWNKIKNICRAHLKESGPGIFDSGPERELLEEFADSLNVRLSQKQYSLKAEGMIVENRPQKTANIRAQGFPTVRIYYIYEARIVDPELIQKISANSRRYSKMDLQKMAREDALQGGKGRANAVLALPLEELKEMYRLFTTGRHSGPICIGEHQFDKNVLALAAPMSEPIRDNQIQTQSRLL